MSGPTIAGLVERAMRWMGLGGPKGPVTLSGEGTAPPQPGPTI